MARTGASVVADKRAPLEVEWRSPDSLTPYPQNARVLSSKAVAKVAASIREFGWRQPIVVDGAGVIIAGHTRLLAARELGLSLVPVVVAGDLTEAQVKAYRLADNRTAQEATWDNDLLSIELGDLASLDFDLSLTGFDAAELKRLAQEPGLTEPDAVPEAPEVPIAKPGDLWLLGAHRLLCGDSTKDEDVARVLGGCAPGLMVVDPPYGVEYDPDWRNRSLGEANPAVDRVTNDDRDDWSDAWALFQGDVVYCWHAGTHASSVADSLTAVGFDIRSQIIWAKQHFVISRGHYHVQHEPCWYCVRSGSTAHWRGDRTQSTLWRINNGLSQGAPTAEENLPTGHGTQKPVECMARPMRNHDCSEVYDPFVGSGTTIIAAEMTGRRCYAVEINPHFVDMAVKRWEQFTGKTAEVQRA